MFLTVALNVLFYQDTDKLQKANLSHTNKNIYMVMVTEQVSACTSTPPEVNVWSMTTTDSHSVTTSQRQLALLIPGSRLNAKNAPGARPLCKRQLLKISRIKQTAKIYQHENFLFLTYPIYSSNMALVSSMCSDQQVSLIQACLLSSLVPRPPPFQFFGLRSI